MSEFISILKLTVDELLENVVNESKNNLQRQGHRLSGSLINSVQKTVTVENNRIKGVIEFLEYGVYQDSGIKKENIPFTSRKRGQGKGGTSDYIEGLKDFAIKRGMAADDKEALSIAFAIAKKHKQYGMHTTNGKPDKTKQGWFSSAVDKFQPEIDKAINQAIGEALNVIVQQAVNEANRNV